MKLYTLIATADYESWYNIYGVFDSEEKAKSAKEDVLKLKNTNYNNFDHLIIEENELNVMDL
jgi:transcription antitermination factor NusG